MFSHTVNAPQLLQHLELHAVLEQAIRVVPGQPFSLLSVQLGSQFQNRIATGDNSLGCQLILRHQCP